VPIASSLQVAVLPGDGIGPEVSAAALEVLDALQKRLGGPRLECTCHPAGAQHYRDAGVALPEATLRACERADAILFGAMGLPQVRYPDGTEIIPQLELRMHFDLYAGMRPVRSLPGLPCPLADARAAAVDLVLVREQTEGLFYARGRADVHGDDEVRDTMRITRKGSERIFDFALGLAERRQRAGRPGRVTCVDKSNVFTSMAFFRRIFEERARRYPGLTTECAYVDATALNLVLMPWHFDVLVTENMFGDILSDLIAGLVGGMGMAPSADLGDRHAVFQPAHGTAPDIAGSGRANPTAMLLSLAMMLDWLGERHGEPRLSAAAGRLERAVAQAFGSGAVRPYEFGGRDGTAEVVRAVLAALAQPKEVRAA